MTNLLDNTKNFVFSKFDTIETVLTVLFAGGMILLMSEIVEILNFKIASWTLWMSLGGLILVYWIMSYKKTNDKQPVFNTFVHKLTWLSYATAVFGILLKVQLEEKAYYALFAGLIAVALSIVLNAYMLIRKEINGPRNIVRALIIGIIALFLFLTEI